MLPFGAAGKEAAGQRPKIAFRCRSPKCAARVRVDGLNEHKLACVGGKEPAIGLARKMVVDWAFYGLAYQPEILWYGAHRSNAEPCGVEVHQEEFEALDGIREWAR